MTDQAIFRRFIRYTSLTIVGMLGLSCYILADTYFIAQGLGDTGLAALNLAIPIYTFIHASALMLGMGGAVTFSLAKSQQKQQKADSAYTVALNIAMVFAVVFVLLGLLLADEITTLLGADEEIFAMTKIYLQTLLFFAPLFIFNEIIVTFVRNDGAPQLAMMAMLGSNLANIILDYVFIFPLQMGMFGAVLATALAPVISLSLMLIHLLSKRRYFHWLGFKEGTPLLPLLALGLPAMLTEVSGGIVMIVFNDTFFHLAGNMGIAAYGIVANLSLVIIAVFNGLAQGIQPLLSAAYGRQQRRQIVQLLQYALVTGLLLAVMIYGSIFIGADHIAALFNSAQEPYLQQIAVWGLKLYFTAIFFVSVNLILVSFFVSLGYSKPAQAISLLRGLIIIVPAALLGAKWWGMTGVWLSFPVTEIIVMLVGIFLFERFRNEIF